MNAPAKRPLSKEMIAALRVLERGPLGRAGEGWIGPGGTFVAHPTVKGLQRHGLAVSRWEGANKRIAINDRGRAEVAAHAG